MGFRRRQEIPLEEFVPLVHRALDGTLGVARPVRRHQASPIVPLMLGAAVGGIIGLAIINWPGPMPDRPVVAAPAVAVAPTPDPPVAAPAISVVPKIQGVPAPPQPSVVSPPDTPKVLTPEMIAQAQRDLTRLGFKAGKPDGVIGKKTRVAVVAFQEAYSLPVDGELTLNLARTLAATP